MSPTDEQESDRRLGAALAVLLERGTWFACLVVGLGLAVQAASGAGSLGLAIVTAGLVVFLALPVLRLLAVLAVFLRRGDRAFAGIAALVLAIIALALAAGAWVLK